MFKKLRRNLAANRLIEERVYAEVSRELERGEVRPGLWAKALANANGDEQKARGLYIKYRVQAMSDEANLAELLIEESRANTSARINEAEAQVKAAEARKKKEEQMRIDAIKKRVRHAGAEYIEDKKRR